MTFEQAILSLGFKKYCTFFDNNNNSRYRKYRYETVEGRFYTIEIGNRAGSKFYSMIAISPYTAFSSLHDIKYNDEKLQEKWQQIEGLKVKLREMGFYPDYEKESW